MDELLDRLLANITDAYDKTEGYIVYDLLKAFAIVMSEHDEQFETLKELLDVDKLIGTMLDTFILQRKGIERNQATYAKGTLFVVGNGTINKGDLFETESGIQFRATETKIINSDNTVSIECVSSGSIGNVPANEITLMPVTLSGITAVTNPLATQDGFEAESDDSLRNRYYLAVRTPATSGNVNHYKQWASNVSGVGGVKVFPLERGNNTVDIVIVDQNKQPASATLVRDVQNYIDPDSNGLGHGEAPVGAFCFVESATPLPIEIKVTISMDNSYTIEQVKGNLEQSITEYLKSVAFQTEYISYAAIGNVLFNAEGVIDYSNLTINNTTTNVAVTNKEVAVLGGVIIA